MNTDDSNALAAVPVPVANATPPSPHGMPSLAGAGEGGRRPGEGCGAGNTLPTKGPGEVSLPLSSFTDPKVRQKLRDELRAEEWAMHHELMAAARVTLKNFYENPHKTTVADLARLIDLASKLGRLATEPDSEMEMGHDTGAVLIEFHAALKKVYARRESEGRPLPAGTVIDAETIRTSNPPLSS